VTAHARMKLRARRSSRGWLIRVTFMSLLLLCH
jgi:hypothetical protein